MASTKLPAELHMTVMAGDEPLPGALVEVELPMRTKNAYRFALGPADSAGRLRITGEELTGYTRRINNLFLMDYVGLAARWTGEIITRPVGRRGVQRLRQAHGTWGHTGVYPLDFPSALGIEHTLVTTHDALPMKVLVEPDHKCVSTRTSLPS